MQVDYQAIVKSYLEKYKFPVSFRMDADMCSSPEEFEKVCKEMNQYSKTNPIEKRNKKNKTQEKEEKNDYNEKKYEDDETDDETNYDEQEILSFIKKKSDIFEEYPDLVEYSRHKRTKLIEGPVQCGKSNIICGIATYNALVEKKTTIIIVRNLMGDYKQLKSKFVENGSFAQFNIPVIYTRGKVDKQFLKIALTGEKPAIIISLSNATQLKTLNMVLGKIKKFKFDLIVDEADDLAYKKAPGMPYIKEFEVLRPKAKQLFLISATVYTPLFKDYNLQSDSIYRIVAPSNYKGVDDINFKPIRFDVKNLEAHNCIQFYKNFGTYETFGNSIIDNDGSTYNHPLIFLHKTTVHVNFHAVGLNVFATNPELKEYWCAISYNGNGIHIYHSSLTSLKELTINGVKGSKSNGIFEFKGLIIGEILQFLKDEDPDASIFTHIVIIAGKLADRGVNFVSSDFKWHLTHQVLHIPERYVASSLVQSIRLCGRYDDNIPLTLYTSQSNINNLRKSLKIQNDLVIGVINYEEILSVKDIIPGIDIIAEHVPKQKLCDKSDYKSLLNIVVHDVQSEKEWGLKNLIENIRARIDERYSTVVLRILNFLWNPSSKTFEKNTKEIIKRECRAKDFSMYTQWQKQHHYYKILVPCENNIYTINHDIIPSIEPLMDEIRYVVENHVRES
jgi:hypothetical protein